MDDERFVPLLEAPAAAGPPIVFVVGTGSVLVHHDDEHADHDLADAIFLGVLDDRPCWALGVEGEPGAGAVPLMGLYGQVEELMFTVAGRAVQLVEWDRTHRFCGRCGSATEQALGERARRCPHCALLAFPRLAPAIITLIERDDGDALLARGRAFPIPMYSCIAGFVEPGETLEQAVHREVREEVGVRIDNVRYWASQPWPFPHSLMLGFNAEWVSGDIVIDETEIIDAQWFSPDDLPSIPPGISIARRLIDDWVTRVR